MVGTMEKNTGAAGWQGSMVPLVDIPRFTWIIGQSIQDTKRRFVDQQIDVVVVFGNSSCPNVSQQTAKFDSVRDTVHVGLTVECLK